MNSGLIFLIGLMGSGKTYWGKKIADVLSWKFVDLDAYIEKQEKMSIPEIFEKSGENHFRNLETQYLKEVMSMNKIIVATGGGTPCFHNNMDLMNRGGETWYLKVKPETSAERLKNETGDRPLLKGKSKDELVSFFTKQLKEREQFYSQATRTIDAEQLNENNLEQLIISRPSSSQER